VCYNRAATIEQTFQSVLNQDYQNIEYIVIDGNSNDGTKAVIEKYVDKIAYYVSEPDGGMYDALNKGLALASGDIVGLVHSDDELFDKYVISRIMQNFKENPEIDFVYGDGLYFSNGQKQRLIRNRISGKFSINQIKNGWLPLHTTVYIKRDQIIKYGGYNLDYKIASDTEFLLRHLYQNKIKASYINMYIIKMKIGGLSTSISRLLEVLKEDYMIYKKYNLPPVRTVFLKKLKAALQYLSF
jgi:glycosyltransferase